MVFTNILDYFDEYAKSPGEGTLNHFMYWRGGNLIFLGHPCHQMFWGINFS